MYIICIRAEFQLFLSRNTREILILSGSCFPRIEIFLRLLKRGPGEISGNDVICDFVPVSEIHRKRCEDAACAALKKQHFIVIRNIHNFAHVCLRGFDDVIKDLRAVAHLKD